MIETSIMNRLSKIFRPFDIDQKSIFNLGILNKRDTEGNGFKLLNNYGLIRPSANGLFYLLPMGYRVIQKLSKLIDNHMSLIGAQKMSSPLLIKDSLWQKADTRLYGNEDIYKITDRSNNKFILSPTHEEAFADLLSREQLSYRNFPLLLYQITPKFRDEFRPRLGLLRSKEFIMKDLYSFDVDEEDALKTYDNVTTAYNNIFKALKIPYMTNVCEKNELSMMSHEYFYFSDHGEDKLYTCRNCKTSGSVSQLHGKDSCPNCSRKLNEEYYENGIEVAHTFIFGTRYSDRLKSIYIDRNGKKKPLHTCSYGIGVSRIFSAAAEILSTPTELRWPSCITPYSICVIPPKSGTADEIEVEMIMPELYNSLNGIPSFKDDVIIDDRSDMSIEERVRDAKAFGFSFIVVAGEHAAENIPFFELYDVYNDSKYLMPKSSLLQYLIDPTRYLSEEKNENGASCDRYISRGTAAI